MLIQGLLTESGLDARCGFLRGDREFFKEQY